MPGDLHVCPFDGCGKSFPKLWRYEEHLCSHTGERRYSCPHEGCDKSYVRKAHLKRHEQTHCTDRQFKCTRQGCQQSFTSQQHLHRHVMLHDGPKPYKCPHPGCSSAFAKRSQLKTHSVHHLEVKPHQCAFEGCSASFVTPSKLTAHMQKHVTGYICSAPDCGQKFAKWSELCSHTKECHPKTKCPVCQKVIKSGRMSQHLKTHSEERELFQCPRENCARKYTTLYNLECHIQSFHDKLRPFSCTVNGCNRKYTTKACLDRHVAAHGQAKVPAKRKKKLTTAHLLSGHFVPHRKMTRRLASATSSEDEGSVSFDDEEDCMSSPSQIEDDDYSGNELMDTSPGQAEDELEEEEEEESMSPQQRQSLIECP